MEPVAIAIICVVVFGAVATLAAFIRQLILSRDKRLNDAAQQKALAQETKELEKLRKQMSNSTRFEAHYQVLGTNKEAIQYFDQRIEEIFKKKSELIGQYADLTLRESSAILANESSVNRKATCDTLKEEIDKELKHYEHELSELQARRSNLWDTHTHLQVYLLEEETRRNKNMDNIYQQHTALLEKIYLRHTENSEEIAKQNTDAASETFKAAIMGPFNFLLSFFTPSSDKSTDAFKKEAEARKKVADMQLNLNEEDSLEKDSLTQSDSLSR